MRSSPASARARRRHAVPAPGFLVAACCLLAGIAVACGSPDPSRPGDQPATSSNATPPSVQTGPLSPVIAFGNYPEFHDPDTGLTVTLGTPDLGVGRNRLAFAITGEQGFLRLPIVTLNTYFFPNGPDRPREGPLETATARFHEFPLGTRGSYVAYASLDREGLWAFEARFPRPDGTVVAVEFETEVRREPKAPALGAPAPRSATPTLSTRGSLARLTTSGEPDPDLYRNSIAEAVESGRPTVLVFTSPAFCTTPLCGPQVEVLSSLHDAYGDRANFVHVDLYEAPDEIKGDLSRARRSPAVEEWGLETDEWTFVIDAEGRIAGRFESFAGEDELVEAIESVLSSAGQAAP